MLQIKKDGVFTFRLNQFERDLLLKLAQERRQPTSELLRSLVRVEADKAGLLSKGEAVSNVNR